jgi:beta-xylosidase
MWRSSAILILGLLLAACGGAASVASVPAGQFKNPVIAHNFADPFILADGATYYGYATGDGTDNIQVEKSTDLVHWTRLADALPDRPAWQPSSTGLTWAPDVAKVGTEYVMYYTARDASLGKQCISFATSSTPQGPFKDTSAAPFVCQAELGGSIDADHFVDSDGTQYLVWKNDGNCCGILTHIWGQQLAADGRAVSGEARSLNQKDDAWEGSLIEGPTLFLHEGTYFLFYSANDYAGPGYAVGYATADHVLGPYTDATENPIIQTKSPAAGPGGQAVVQGPHGQTWMAYHAWDVHQIGDDAGGRRAMWIDRLILTGKKAVVKGPTAVPQPTP